MEEKLGEVLRKNRKEKNLTLRAVQEKTGLSNAYLSQIETGKIRRPSPNVLFKLSKLYDFSYEKLLSLAGHPLPNESTPMISSRFQENLNGLSEDEKESVLEYIEFIKSRRR
jgi:transcriptional regulator with XRE-family HTH domain